MKGSSSIRPKTAPETDISRVLYRSAKGNSLNYPESDSSTPRELSDKANKTDKLLRQFTRPWVPRSATLGEVTYTVNRQGAPIHQAILRQHEKRPATHNGARTMNSPRLNDAAVKEIEAAFDKTMRNLQETLNQEKQPMALMFASKKEDAEKAAAASPRKGSSKGKQKPRSAPAKKASRRALNKQRESVDGGVEREIDQSRLPTGKRLEVKLEELRHDNESAKQLHRSVATMKAEGANVDANGKKPTNFHRVNRLAIKVMESMPIPGGDPCSHDYDVRNQSPSRTERRHYKHTNYEVEKALSKKKLPKWQEQIEDHISLGGAPYPRTVYMADLPQRRSARASHRNQVITRKEKLYREVQSAREESATRHERRIQESIRSRIEAAELEERQFRQRHLLSIFSTACVFNDLADKILKERRAREERDKQHRAALMIFRMIGRYMFRKRQITDVGFLMKLSSMMKPWVQRARAVVRKRHANIMLALLQKLQDSNQVAIAMKTFRERVLTIQKYWKAAIKGRHAKLNVLYLQWMRYETNLIKDRKKQDAEYEARLKREVAMMHPSKRRAAAKKLEKPDSGRTPGVVKEKSEDIEDNDGISLALRDEDIQSAMATMKNRYQGAVPAAMPEIEEEEEAVEEVNFAASRKIKTEVPGADGLHMNYAMLKKVGVKGLKHGMSEAEASKKKEEEEEEEFKNRRVPRDIKVVINQIIYQRSKLKFFRDLSKYEEDMVIYANNAPFEEIRLELFAKAGLTAERKLFQPLRPHVKIILDRNTLAFMHSKGVRMMQVREAEERQRRAEIEGLMSEESSA